MLVSLSLALLALPLQAAPCPELEPALSALDGRGACLTPAIRAAWLLAETPQQRACVVDAMAQRGLPARPFAPGRAVAETRAPLPELSVRDPYDLPNQAISEHFVLLWGDDVNIYDSQIDNLLGAFEMAWNNHIDTMGMPAPYDTDNYYFNVYVGSSGGPEISGASGYFTTDDEDFPMIVMEPSILNYHEYASTTAVHEFFHAAEWATGHYVTYDSMWFWEACAVWSENIVFPDFDDYAGPLPGFAFMPYLPLHHFDYPDTGQLVEMHHYGAFIWPRFISEFVGNDMLTINVWTTGTAGADPLYYYDDLIYRASGLALEDVWGDFLGHNTVWDYQDRDLYLSFLDQYDNWYTDDSLAGTYTGPGMETWSGARDHPPQNMGANNLLLSEPQSGVIRFEFEGHTRGSSDSVAEWQIRVVLVQDGAYDYVPLIIEGGKASWASDGVANYDAVYVAIGSWAVTWYEGESFDYDYRLWVEGAFPDTGLPEDTGEGEKPGLCGCSGVGGAAGLAWLGLLGLGAVLASRRDAEPQRVREGERA